MKSYPKINTISSICEPRVRYNNVYPAIRIQGKWLKEFTEIGKKYSIKTNKNKLIITFLNAEK